MTNDDNKNRKNNSENGVNEISKLTRPANFEGDEVESVLVKLGDSIDVLEGIVDGKVDKKSANQDFAAEVQRMGADRVRLANSLDDAEARCQRLESVNREVSSRLVNAMETIRCVLDKESRT